MSKEKIWVKLKKKFNSSAHARQELEEMEAKGKISNYRISWDTQLRMVVEIIKTDKL